MMTEPPEDDLTTICAIDKNLSTRPRGAAAPTGRSADAHELVHRRAGQDLLLGRGDRGRWRGGRRGAGAGRNTRFETHEGEDSALLPIDRVHRSVSAELHGRRPERLGRR